MATASRSMDRSSFSDMNKDETMKLSGIFPPIVTPFRDGQVDTEALAFNVQKWNETGLAGYVPLGSTGEFVHLTPAERERVIATVREYAAPGKVVIAGTGSLSTDEAIRLTRRAGELGADAAMVVTPFYYTSQMTDAALWGHYTAVADASPIPILLYNVPVFTHLNMAVETVARLAEHPNIIGMKDSSGNVDQLTQIVHSTPEEFILLSGAAGVLHPALTVGANGAILAISNVVPELCVEIYELVQANDHATARRRQAVLGALNRAISRYGIGGYK
ncbi:MAG: dihydrodipicolinate synthase family protein, partial [Chloroflexi bacterium]